MGKTIKCSTCEYGKKYSLNHTGVGAAAYIGTYSAEHYICNNPKVKHTPSSIQFSGKTRPRNCPLK